MFGSLKQRWQAWEGRLNATIAKDLATPEARRAAEVHYRWIDHGILRVFWDNFYKVAEGVYRSNQPSAAQLRAAHARVGLRSVLNLRGKSQHSFHLFEEEACRELGIDLVDLSLSASQAPSVEKLEELIALFRSMAKPVLIHCKSGADRTGLAAAIYLLVIENKPIEVAQKQLSLRYLHVANSPAGVQDHLLRVYAAAHKASGIGFLDWMRRGYDPAEVTASFARWRAGERSLTG
jgi:protein tyrosine phosphatase (PTP) superfamily phosphohydrolase (DUF442 family)